MRYISTRGQAEALGFEDVLLAGLASDGGLYLPETLPKWDADFLSKLKAASYEEIAYQVLAPFVEGAFYEAEFRALIAKTYARFNHISRAPLVQSGDNEWILELHRGPTLAFKDFAMQLIGNLFETVLARRGKKLTIITATSGDTGSAALEAFKGLENVNLFILFPKGRVSEVQQRQMTTSAAANVHPLAIKEDFDDCQALLKASFNDHAFRDAIRLGGVNSINWARVMAQIVYYVSAALSLGAPERKVSFSVPTGNFGDIYAGYLAKRMGLPIDRLVIATNQNDILHRTLVSGVHKKAGVRPSISPSMDIQVSSNFERLLFDLYDRNAQEIVSLMNGLSNSGGFTLSANALEKLRAEFDSAACSEEETKEIIKQVYLETGMLICPHSAVGVYAARANPASSSSPMVVLSTAHAAKFPDAVEEATGERPDLPPFLSDLFERQEQFDVLDAELGALQKYVRERV